MRSFCALFATRTASTPGLGTRAFFGSSRSSHTQANPFDFPLFITENAKRSVPSSAPGRDIAILRTSACVAMDGTGEVRERREADATSRKSNLARIRSHQLGRRQHMP